MDELTILGLKHFTDKAYWHRYTEFYFNFFNLKKNDTINILEIGIAHGGSIKMLHDFFPNSNIYCFDIDERYVNNIRNYSKRVYPFQIDCGNQKKLNDLIKSLNVKFDIVVDDGSHIPEHQFISLNTLFPFVSKNGLFIVEDIHTSVGVDDINQNMIYFLENIKKYKNPLIDTQVCNNLITSQLNFYKRNTVPYFCFFCHNKIERDAKQCINCIDRKTIFIPNTSDSFTCVIRKT